MVHWLIITQRALGVYRNVYRTIHITLIFIDIAGVECFRVVPFARSKFKSPEVYLTQFSLDKSAVIAFC